MERKLSKKRWRIIQKVNVARKSIRFKVDLGQPFSLGATQSPVLRRHCVRARANAFGPHPSSDKGC